MKDGFVRVAAGTPAIRVADCPYNTDGIIALMRQADQRRVKVLVLPELCVTGYTCADLFLQDALLHGALEGLSRIVAQSDTLDVLTFVGMPIEDGGRLYNCAVAVQGGKILGVTTKRNIPNYSVYYERRHFTPGEVEMRTIRLLGQEVPFGNRLIFECENMPSLRVAAEICEDLWVPMAPSIEHALAGATVLVNLSASDENVGKSDYRRQLVAMQSARLLSGYIYADAGQGESSQDMVYGGHNIICENGRVMAESERYTTGLTVMELDLQHLEAERRRMSSFGKRVDGYMRVPFTVQEEYLPLLRWVDPAPFVPDNQAERDKRCEEILSIQAQGLMQRLRHIHGKCAVIGVSGGLDSTLAVLVTARAFKALGLDMKGIKAVTMPCFGTTKRTRSNAQVLAESLGMDFEEINITEAVRVHFRDIGQDETVHDVTYENCQARERTQVLMDIANKTGGIVIGTGDLSELALGWATYNGDHMSMYAVNCSIPKTLIRYLVRYEADHSEDEAMRKVLLDILDTPVSPELLPPVDGDISQKTEDLVGPYELHDFFLYHMLRRACTPKKVLRLAIAAFGERYEEEVIRSWLKVFCRRFFSQQFKRSCLPDGPKVGSVTLSPRGDLRMPSDASNALWTLD